MAENIVHLVLARTPDAPRGREGHLAVHRAEVPAQGRRHAGRAQRRAMRVDRAQARHPRQPDGRAWCSARRKARSATWWARRTSGLAYMFIMMNAARFASAWRAWRSAERAYQQALAYAKERVQGTRPRAGAATTVPIIRHPDVRRMLMSMKSQTEAMRALAYVVAAAMDYSRHRDPDKDERARHQAFVDLMIPVVKGWSTEIGIEVASTRRAGARRHGLHRGDRRRAAPARCAHHHDLRGHHRHPGQRPGRPQDRARGRA